MNPVPPTPTPLPPPESLPLNMPDISVWDMTDSAIQTWNSAPEIAQPVQGFIILAIVIGIIFVIYARAHYLTTKD